MTLDRELRKNEQKTVRKFLAILDDDEIKRLEGELNCYSNSGTWWFAAEVLEEIRRRKGA